MTHCIELKRRDGQNLFPISSEAGQYSGTKGNDFGPGRSNCKAYLLPSEHVHELLLLTCLAAR